MAEFVNKGAKLQTIVGNPVEINRQRLDHFMNRPDTGAGESVSQISAELKQTMTKNCGVFRDDSSLKKAQQEIKQLQDRFRNAHTMDSSRRFNTDLLGAIETEHLLTFSEIIVASGLARTESRGAHYRTDFVSRDDEHWLKHTLATKNGDAGPVLSYKPVHIFWDRYPPQERKY